VLRRCPRVAEALAEAQALAQATSLGELNLTFSSAEAEREGGLNKFTILNTSNIINHFAKPN
jgi:hypothetical protein